MKIAVIGSGTMGNGIAHALALFDNEINLVDDSSAALENALSIININLSRQLSKGAITSEQFELTLNNINTFTELTNAIHDVDLVIEAVTENDNVKLNLFKKLDQICKPSTILASNTSSISISHLATATRRPDKVIGMHFMNPVPLMKLVEVIRGSETSAETTRFIMELTEKIDKVAVEVNDAPGFVSNRILMPMINEAAYTLYEGIAGVNEIDTVMMLGMSHPMGPLQLADYIGLDVCLAILRVMEVGFDSSKYTPCPLLVDMVDQGQKGIKTGLGFYDYSMGTKNTRPAPRFAKASIKPL